MKKILFLVQLPPPTHGASTVNKYITDSKVVKNEFNTSFVNISPSDDISDIGKFHPRKLIKSLHIFVIVLREYFRFKPDLIYITLSPHGYAFYKDGLFVILLKMLGGKLVFHLHGKGIIQESGKSFLRKSLYRYVFKNVNVIHLSKMLFFDVDEVADKSKKIIDLPNGIKLPPVNQNVSKSKIICFVYLSNITKEKGVDVLIRAASLLSAEYQNKFEVKIIGAIKDKEYGQEVERLVRNNSYKNISLLGPMYNEEKFEELNRSHIFVLPTYYRNECFPLSILEAMGLGLPIISTKEGAIPEIVVDGVHGDIVENVNPVELSEKMLSYLVDSDKIERCSLECKKKFKKYYKIEVFEENLVRILHSL